MLAASIIRAMMGPDDGGSKHLATTQKTVIFILIAMRTSHVI
jgi:hypothetical protein